MIDPYEILGLPDAAGDQVIRNRYLELVREFTPERSPEKFAAIRAAYESTRDLNTRLRHRLFEMGKRESLDNIIQEVTCRTSRRRVSLKTLLSLVQKP